MALELNFLNEVIYEKFSLKKHLVSEGINSTSASWKGGWPYKLWLQCKKSV
jgi:hypothetical protein